jgi:AcrR family transcriptional regulator
MGTSERRERDRQEMRRMILETAKKLFLKDGFENVSIRRIAEKIEYSPATVYLYFKDKDEILYALHTEGFEMLYAEQRKTLVIKDPWQRLRACGETYLKFAMENQEYYDLMFIMSATGNVISEQKSEWDVGIRSYDMLRDSVQACIDAGYLPKVDVEIASFALWSLVHGMASLVIRNRCMIPGEQVEHAMRGALEFSMNAMRTRK